MEHSKTCGDSAFSLSPLPLHLFTHLQVEWLLGTILHVLSLGRACSTSTLASYKSGIIWGELNPHPCLHLCLHPSPLLLFSAQEVNQMQPLLSQSIMYLNGPQFTNSHLPTTTPGSLSVSLFLCRAPLRNARNLCLIPPPKPFGSI